MDFCEFFQASVKCGSVFRHRCPFQAAIAPIIVTILFPESLSAPSSWIMSVASPASFVVPPPCEITHFQELMQHLVGRPDACYVTCVAPAFRNHHPVCSRESHCFGARQGTPKCSQMPFQPSFTLPSSSPFHALHHGAMHESDCPVQFHTVFRSLRPRGVWE